MITSDEIFFIDGSYSSVCKEYRDNPNPIVKCGHWVSCYDLFILRPERLVLYDIVNNIYGEFYHIDPTSVFYFDDPVSRGIKVGFKAKSKVNPYLEELEDYRTECLLYWINNLEVSQ